MFFVQTNSTGVDYRYELTLNGTKFTGRIEAEAAKEQPVCEMDGHQGKCRDSVYPGRRELGLTGRKAGRNTMNSASLERLF